jgi:hypothetical protein
MPYDSATGEFIPEIWGRWLAKDPVRMAPSTQMRCPHFVASTSTRITRRTLSP